MKSTETANSVNTSHLKLTFARESVQLVTHIKIQSVFQNVYQDSEITDLVVAQKSELLLDVHSPTSTNKDHAFHHAMLVHIQILPTESVKLVALTVSHACHLLSVPAAAQVLI